MARRSDWARPVRVLCAWLALTWAALPLPLAGAAEGAGPLQSRLELGTELRPDGEKPVLLTTVPEPEAPTLR